jgi:DNA polymerase-3 subunit beta
MEFIINKSVVANAAKMLAKVISRKPALPILQNILFEVEDNHLWLTASDYEVILQANLDLDKDCGNRGKFCVSPKSLQKALANVSEQPLTFTYDDIHDTLTIQHEHGEFLFHAEPADEYPLPSGQKYCHLLSMPAAKLATILKRTYFAIADDELRPIMNGVCLSAKDERLDIVASDGHTLVRTRLHPDLTKGTNDEIIMPSKAAKIAPFILKDLEADIVTSAKWSFINCGQYRLSFMHIDGKYPNYNMVIPREQPHTAVIWRDLFLKRVKQIAPFTNDSSESVHLTIAQDIILTGDDFDFLYGASAFMPIEYTGEPIKMALRSSTLQKVLQHLPGEQLKFMFKDASHCTTFEPSEQPAGEEITMLLMPMIIND